MSENANLVIENLGQVILENPIPADTPHEVVMRKSLDIIVDLVFWLVGGKVGTGREGPSHPYVIEALRRAKG